MKCGVSVRRQGAELRRGECADSSGDEHLSQKSAALH